MSKSQERIDQSRRELIGRILEVTSGVLLIGGVKEIVFSKIARAQEEGSEIVAVDSLSAGESPEDSIGLRPFPEVIGDPKINKVTIYNKDSTHGLNMDEKSYQLIEQLAARYEEKSQAQRKIWKPIEAHLGGPIEQIPGNSSPLNVTEYFVESNGQRYPIGSKHYADIRMIEVGGKIILSIGFNSNIESVLTGPLFLGKPAVGDDNETFIQYRRAIISEQIFKLIGGLMQNQDIIFPRWPKDETEEGFRRIHYDTEILNLYPQLSLQIV